jgi:hypothetical protein
MIRGDFQASDCSTSNVCTRAFYGALPDELLSGA